METGDKGWPKVPPGSISHIIIHQIFSLARDWSKHVTGPNVGKYSSIFKTVCVTKKI